MSFFIMIQATSGNVNKLTINNYKPIYHIFNFNRAIVVSAFETALFRRRFFSPQTNIQ